MKPFPTAMLEAKIFRYLLDEGRPCDFTEIRFDADLDKVARGKVWSAIRSLIESGWVSYSYRVEKTFYEGFAMSMSYPVFWINRDNVIDDESRAVVADPRWWRDYVAALRGREVRP